jgi:hypothetical protein
MSDPNLTPDQFLYGRRGPWPQPSPSHPLLEAYEVLTVPPIEAMLWQSTIGARYLQTQIGYPPVAAGYAVQEIEANDLGPDDARFAEIMLGTCYQRFLLPLDPVDETFLEKERVRRAKAGLAPIAPITAKYDFGAMDLVRPLAGMHCAPTRVYFAGLPQAGQRCALISVGDVHVAPDDRAWALARLFALQGAAYHMLFVVHPALHFPMDAVNAVTKTAVPHTHPLFQLLHPHTAYTLALDNAVLESDASVVNQNAQGTWFDPLTGDAYNLKLLFAAGYAGLDDPRYRGAYPRYDYQNPALIQMPGATHRPVFDTAYSRWQSAYFTRAFLPLCRTVAKVILTSDPQDTYVRRWGDYLKPCVHGFPTGDQLLQDAECLARTLAIYLWDVTLAHGADHASFGGAISPAEKALRLRCAPPASPQDAPPTLMAQICRGDDLLRSAMANEMFFAPSTMAPNLDQTGYAFTDPKLAAAQRKFHADLRAVADDPSLTQFMPLVANDKVTLRQTIPASIQY